MKTLTQKSLSIVTTFALLMFYLVAPLSAHAAGLTSISDVMTRQAVGVASGHVITFTTLTGIVSGTISLTFPAGFVIPGGAVVTGTAGGGSVALSSIARQVITLTASDVPASQVVAITITNTPGITNPAVASPTSSDYQIDIVAGSDSGSVVVPIVTNDTVSLTATVAPTLTFELTDEGNNLGFDSAIQFGNLTPSATTWATNSGNGTTVGAPAGGAHGLRVGTNAPNGYVVTVSGATLTSGANNIDALTSQTVPTSGTEQFGLCIKQDTAATDLSKPGVINSGYDCASGYKFLTPASNVIASNNGISGPTSLTSYDVNYVADISASTAPGAYSTALTYNATATF